MTTKTAALDILEHVADSVDETVDTLERIPNLALNGTTRKQQIVILTATALVAGGVGAAVSYFATRKVMAAKFETLLDYQLQEAEKHYTVLKDRPDLTDIAAKIDEVEQAATEATQYIEQTRPYSGSGPVEPTVVENADGTLVPAQSQSIWDTEGVIGRWDPEQEASKRLANPDEPYVITRQDYEEGLLDHTMEELAYYAGDDSLVEPDDTIVPVHMVDKTVGEANLLRFGHGSDDPNVVYVRNERLEIDYEITRNEGLASREVAGFDDDDEEVTAFGSRRR